MQLDLGAALAYSLVSPYMVKEVLRGWREEDAYEVKGGFVLSLCNDEFAYITFLRRKRDDYAASSTAFFQSEPFHIYARGVEWVTDKEVLNSGTEKAKQEANYPTGGLAGRAAPGSVVRIPI